jgi:xanthine dehydrogenase YagS FAD-binding subunit
MRPFAYQRAASIAQALEHLAPAAGEARHAAVLAGGTDLLPLMHTGAAAPARLIDIKRAADMPASVVDDGAGGVYIGALVRLGDLVRDPLLRTRYPMLVHAVCDAATEQLRNVATVGGNLLQRPRCWYFRNSGLRCWLHGGEHCLARDGENREHAIFGDGPCRAVHPSDPAVALLALDAAVRIAGSERERTLAIDALYAEPSPQRRRETVLEEELILGVELPASAARRRSAWVKEKARKTWAFALASAAVSLDVDDGVVRDARIALGGVAPMPWRAAAAESVLRGAPADASRDERACDAALDTACALSDNGYKIDLARTALRRCLLRALPDTPARR